MDICSLPSPIIHFDQIEFTVKTRMDSIPIYELLEQALDKGRTIRTKTEGGSRWGVSWDEYNIYCSRYQNAFGYTYLNCTATKENLSLFGSVAGLIKTNFKLYSVEIAFDFPFPELNHTQVECLATRISRRIYCPSTPRARGNSKSGDFFECADGATNGTRTDYLHSMNQTTLRQTREKTPGKSIGMKTKVYSKKLHDIWHVRVEATLYRNQLKRNFPVLPRELDRILKWEKDFSFSDFWKLYHVDIDGFQTELARLVLKKNKKVPPYLYSMVKSCRNKPLHDQIAGMRKIAAKFKCRRLADSVWAYARPMTLQEAFFTPLDDEAD